MWNNSEKGLVIKRRVCVCVAAEYIPQLWLSGSATDCHPCDSGSCLSVISGVWQGIRPKLLTAA